MLWKEKLASSFLAWKTFSQCFSELASPVLG